MARVRKCDELVNVLLWAKDAKLDLNKEEMKDVSETIRNVEKAETGDVISVSLTILELISKWSHRGEERESTYWLQKALVPQESDGKGISMSQSEYARIVSDIDPVLARKHGITPKTGGASSLHLAESLRGGAGIGMRAFGAALATITITFLLYRVWEGKKETSPALVLGLVCAIGMIALDIVLVIFDATKKPKPEKELPKPTPTIEQPKTMSSKSKEKKSSTVRRRKEAKEDLDKVVADVVKKEEDEWVFVEKPDKTE